METKQGKEIYRWRKITVEPVIGQIKENFGFRQFCLRGLEGARIEINIVSIVHNLKKIWKYRREFGEKCKNVEKIILFCVEIIVIVGQRPLLYGVRTRSEKIKVISGAFIQANAVSH